LTHQAERSSHSDSVWLNPIEKVRLDARRIAFASKMTTPEKLERLMTIVRKRLPVLPTEQKYDQLSQAEDSRLGFGRLSQYVKKKVGLCRERSFLLASVLNEVGIKSHVKYGDVYDNKNTFLSGHAWVKATVDGKPLLLDPSVGTTVRPIKRVAVGETVGGHIRKVKGIETSDFLYVPTPDLVVSRVAPAADSRPR
jgi:hypothetical protein